jgi:hypothetical protein
MTPQRLQEQPGAFFEPLSEKLMVEFWLKWIVIVLSGWTAMSVTAGLGYSLLRIYGRRRESRRRDIPAAATRRSRLSAP